MDRLEYEPTANRVTYPSDKPDGPTAGAETLDPLEFLARLAAHIPNKRQVMTRYYGWFANRPRGTRRKRAALAGIGIVLIAGITMRIATAAGATLLVFMWSAALPPANNPFMDDHIVYALVLVALALVGAGKTLGLGVRWERIPMVQRYGILT